MRNFCDDLRILQRSAYPFRSSYAYMYTRTRALTWSTRWTLRRGKRVGVQSISRVVPAHAKEAVEEPRSFTLQTMCGDRAQDSREVSLQLPLSLHLDVVTPGGEKRLMEGWRRWQA